MNSRAPRRFQFGALGREPFCARSLSICWPRTPTAPLRSILWAHRGIVCHRAAPAGLCVCCGSFNCSPSGNPDLPLAFTKATK
ncbi:unnamed protein product [Amoebophrya sp. A120]|nr:unnamed protein product [Amoebophrya sp. A120]|eukprot:GSA120T00002226001.1